MLTRTVCLIGLSRFLLSSCTQDKFVMVLAPGHAHLNPIKIIYTLTVFWLRDSLYRDTTPVLPTSFVTGDKFAAPIKIVPRPRQNSIKFVP
jgi:hypothetical protein